MAKKTTKSTKVAMSPRPRIRPKPPTPKKPTGKKGKKTIPC